MFREGTSGRFDVTVGPKTTMGKTVSEIFSFHIDMISAVGFYQLASDWLL